MPLINYQIQFQGKLIPPINRATVIRRLAALYREDLNAFDSLFNGKRYILKESMDKSLIDRYVEIYVEMGLSVELIEYSNDIDTNLSGSQGKFSVDNSDRDPDSSHGIDEGLGHMMDDIKEHLTKNNINKD